MLSICIESQSSHDALSRSRKARFQAPRNSRSSLASMLKLHRIGGDGYPQRGSVPMRTSANAPNDDRLPVGHGDAKSEHPEGGKWKAFR